MVSRFLSRVPPSRWLAPSYTSSALRQASSSVGCSSDLFNDRNRNEHIFKANGQKRMDQRLHSPRLFRAYSTHLRFCGACSAQQLFFRSYSAAQSAQNIFELESDDDFDERVLQAEHPVLVQFYADWCGPCQNLSPRLEAKVNGQQGRVSMARVNVDGTAGFLASQFEVNSVPTVLCLSEGEVVHRFEGDVDDDYLDKVVANLAAQGREREEED